MQFVEYAQAKQRITKIECDDKFQFRKDKKYHLIQKALFWMLDKIGAYALHDQITYETHRIDTENLVFALQTQKRDLMRVHSEYGERLLIGSDDFAKLMGTPEIRNMRTFVVDDNPYGGPIMGLKVTIVPWMKGMLVMPKEF